MAKKSNRKIVKQQLPEDKYQVSSLSDLKFENLKNVIRYNPYAWMLIGLVIIGCILRFVNLGFNSLWLDEGATFEIAQNSFVGIWETTMGGEVNPPLFYWIESVMLFFGNSEFILRFVPALMGCLTIPVLYFVGKEIGGRLCGIVTAGLITFSSFHVYYSQEARAYTTMLFFFSLVLLFYLLALKTNKIWYWILSGLFASLAFWTHFYVFVGISILYLHAIIVNWRKIRENIMSILPILASLGTFIIVSLPLIVVTVGLFIMRTSSEPTWGYSGFDLIYSTLYLLSGSELYLTVIFTILALTGIIWLFKKEESRQISLLILLSLILTFVISIFLAEKMPISPRHLMFILPFFFTAIGAAFTLIPKEIDYKKVGVILLVLICLVNLPYFTVYYTSFSKEDWRGMSQELSELTSDGDYVVTVPSYVNLPLDYYYDNSIDRTIEKGATTAEELEQINKERGEHTAYFVVTGHIYAANPNGDALMWLNSNSVLTTQTHEIYLFKSA